MEKLSLRKMDWAEVIVYFTLLKDKVELTPKDLVDYFHFRYIDLIGIERWTQPNYIRQKSCAEKIMALYGAELSIKLIDELFASCEKVLNKSPENVMWSLGILSSEKTGWIIEKLLVLIQEKELKTKQSRIMVLLSKDRNQWSQEEAREYKELIQRGENGKTEN